jgi:predicted kinase
MKVLIFGNLASGKSYLAEQIQIATPIFEYLAVDDFRRKIGDGTMEQEKIAKNNFLNSIKRNCSQLIEATGLGDTGIKIADKLKNTNEIKNIVILKTPLEICLERLKCRVGNVPYPAPPEQATRLAIVTHEMLENGEIQMIWGGGINCHIIEVEINSDSQIQQIIKQIHTQNETIQDYQ